MPLLEKGSFSTGLLLEMAWFSSIPASLVPKVPRHWVVMGAEWPKASKVDSFCAPRIFWSVGLRDTEERIYLYSGKCCLRIPREITNSQAQQIENY